MDPGAGNMWYEDMAAFATVLMQEQATGRTNQVVMEAVYLDISRKL